MVEAEVKKIKEMSQALASQIDYWQLIINLCPLESLSNFCTKQRIMLSQSNSSLVNNWEAI